MQLELTEKRHSHSLLNWARDFAKTLGREILLVCRNLQLGLEENAGMLGRRNDRANGVRPIFLHNTRVKKAMASCG